MSKQGTRDTTPDTAAPKDAAIGEQTLAAAIDTDAAGAGAPPHNGQSADTAKPTPAPGSNAQQTDMSATRAASEDVFPSFDTSAAGTPARELDMVMDIPVTLSVELGRTRLTIKQLLELAQGSVVKLDGLPGEPMDILINGYLIAQGEVVVVEEKFGIRVTEIVTPSERLQRLNR